MNSASTSSYGLSTRKEENHLEAMVMLRTSSMCLRTVLSSGYLWPTSQPSKPASFISEMHCWKVFSSPRSHISSLDQPIGQIPSLTFFGSNIVIPSIIFSLRLHRTNTFRYSYFTLMHCKCQTHFFTKHPCAICCFCQSANLCVCVHALFVQKPCEIAPARLILAYL